MRGHNLGFYGEINYYPQIIPVLPLLILATELYYVRCSSISCISIYSLIMNLRLYKFYYEYILDEVIFKYPVTLVGLNIFYW